MDTPHLSSLPGNYELQEAFLRGKQQEISNRLFEFGVVSRLVETTEPTAGVKTDVRGIAQLDKVFVPSISTASDGRDKVLSLAAITPEQRGRSFTYFRLGMIDETGTLFPLPGVNHDDAAAVHALARELIEAREDGTLPNLDSSLLSIKNPNTGMCRL